MLLTINASEYGLSPVRRQVIILTDADILLIGPLGTMFSDILIGIHTFSFKEMHVSSVKWRPRLFNENLWRFLTLFKPPYVKRGGHFNDVMKINPPSSDVTSVESDFRCKCSWIWNWGPLESQQNDNISPEAQWSQSPEASVHEILAWCLL